MEELRALPKAFAVAIGLKILIAITLVISIIIFASIGLAIYLYTHNHPLHIALLSGLALWAGILLLLWIVAVYKNNEVQKRKDYLLWVANKEIVTIVALHSLNTLLRKLREHKRD